jgi:Dipeptidyl peptidase IV (DPP IV) N-terminal region.
MLAVASRNAQFLLVDSAQPFGAAATALACAALAPELGAQAGTTVAPAAIPRIANADSARLTLERIFSSNEFEPEDVPSLRWTEDGKGYTMLEPSSGPQGGRDLVRYDAANGRRTVIVPASRLLSPNSSNPMDILDYQFAADQRRVLIFTNARRVWREYTRGDYWSYDIARGALRKLGGPSAAPSTLMFAKFSPDGARVAYVRANNLYVEDLATGGSRRSRRTARARSSMARSTGCTKRSSTFAMVFGGARMASASRTGS